jgi:hypothetical protein
MHDKLGTFNEMARPSTIRVMISSRCNDPIPFRGKPAKLTEIRIELKNNLEKELLFGSQLYEVWINEDAPPAEGSADSWDTCMEQVRLADIVLVLYNGNAGWAKEGADVGICLGELQRYGFQVLQFVCQTLNRKLPSGFIHVCGGIVEAVSLTKLKKISEVQRM